MEKIQRKGESARYVLKIAKTEVKTELGMNSNVRPMPTQKLDGTMELPEDETEADSFVAVSSPRKKAKLTEEIIIVKRNSTDESESAAEEVVFEDNEEEKVIVKSEDTEVDDDRDKGTSTVDLDYSSGDDDDDFLEEVSNEALQTIARQHGQFRKKPVSKPAPKPKQDGQPKRIYIKTNAYAKNEHYMMIKEEGQKMYQCKICEWKTKYIVSVKDHVRNHMNEKPFICGVCNKAFSNQSNLNSHLARHYENRPFSCDVCGLNFKLKSSLNCHKKRHFEEKRFECELCGKKVFTRSSLKQHQLSHSDHRPFQCELCFKRFKTAPLLERHSFIHSGGGKYECHICSEAFARKEYWRVHMRKKHNEDFDHEKRQRCQSIRQKELEVSTSFQEAPETETYTEMAGFQMVPQEIHIQPQVITVQPQEIHIQEGAFNVVEGEAGGTQISVGEEIIGVIATEEDLAALKTEGTVENLDKDTKAQVEYLVNLQYEYVK